MVEISRKNSRVEDKKCIREAQIIKNKVNGFGRYDNENGFFSN
jgi:hypothetical protein